MNATDPGGTGPRRPTAVDAIAEAHLDRLCALDPLFATEIGRGGHDDRLTDFSAQGCAERAEVAAGTLSALGGADVVDAIDRVTVATMSASLRRELALADAGEHIGDCNVIASPLQALRDVFDLMPTDTREQRETFLSRLTAIPASLTDVVDGLGMQTILHGHVGLRLAAVASELLVGDARPERADRLSHRTADVDLCRAVLVRFRRSRRRRRGHRALSVERIERRHADRSRW